MDKGYSRPTARSRELRAQATAAERYLWTALSARKVGNSRFNRQFPIGPYICDFVSRAAKLIIEVDGESHDQTIAYDMARTRFLAAEGYHVIRFSNADVMGNLDGVAKAIELALADSPSRKRAGSLWGPTVRWDPRP